MDDAANSKKTAKRIIGRPFPPGVSGNPSGRPKRKPIFDAIADELGAKETRDIVKALIAAASRRSRPDTRAAEFLRDSYEGKPSQSIEHSGEIGITSRRETIAKRRAERLSGDK